MRYVSLLLSFEVPICLTLRKLKKPEARKCKRKFLALEFKVKILSNKNTQ